jgi:hypothetical protein
VFATAAIKTRRDLSDATKNPAGGNAEGLVQHQLIGQPSKFLQYQKSLRPKRSPR